VPISPHAAYLREHVGHATLLLPAAAAIVRDEAERILLIRRSDNGSWSLPGGMMEPGERVADCVVREVREETGLEVEVVRLVGVCSDPAFTHVTYPNGDQVHFVSATFECRVIGGQPRPDGDESLEVAYWVPDSLPETIVPGHQIRILDALDGREAAFFR
jgi:8-oxo-dGTP diphosphatase